MSTPPDRATTAGHAPLRARMRGRLGAAAAVAFAAAVAIAGALGPARAQAAELTVDDGVVIKFGSGARLVVRDKLTAGKGVVLTSQKDDTAGGQANATPQVPAPADWGGLHIEKSAATFGSFTLTDWALRYAGAGVGSGSSANPADGAAFSLRGFSPGLQYLQLSNNAVGLYLDAASPAITGSSFLRNGSGLVAAGGSAPSVGSTQFVGNAVRAIDNLQPATVIQATGNWWGAASGPRDSVGNPQGQGDAVSAGVAYTSFLAAAPLIAPTARLTNPAPFFEQRTVSLDIACFNATEYRIAEGTAFAGTPFQTLPNGRATVDFTVSAGDGLKALNVQFRNAAGTVVSASVAGGVLIDTLPPQVAISNPAPGSVIRSPITVEVTASDPSGIASVGISIDNVLVVTRSAPPYTHAWNTDAAGDGSHTIRAVATDGAGRVSEQTATVTVTHTQPTPDTDGPVMSNIRVDGVPLANGAVLTRNATVTLAASDPSGVARIDLLLDGATVGTASSGYTVALSFDGVANGSHTLALRALDSLGNTSTVSFTITLQHAVPTAPSISQPVSGSTTRVAAQPVSGTAQAGSTVQLFVNGQPGSPGLTAGSDGHFAGNVTLMPGANQIRATASDLYGTSALSTAVTVTLDTAVPSSPGNLTAAAQAAGKVHLAWTRSTDPNAVGYDVYRAPNAFTDVAEAVKVNSSRMAATVYDDMPPQDAGWTYRVVAVNAANTPSLPTNAAQVTSDATAPRAVSIVYTPLGKTDPATGRIGQGRVNVVLTVSEALQGTPYLSIVPQGGAPIGIELARTADTVYGGNFLIDANTASGTANAIFSARDLVGNRGTDVSAGATLAIDTAGPVLSSIVLAPAAPIRNDPARTVQATLVFNKAPVGAPQVKYLLSGPVRAPTAVSSLTQVNPTTYSASFALPADAGLPNPELLSFSFQAKDDLDNVSTKVAAFNRFQVYQGNLPPLDTPFGFTAKAQPAGKVLLTWQAVDEAASYQIYRQQPGQTQLQPLVRAAGVQYVDQTPLDGAYRYAVATVRQSNGQESVSGPTAAADVVASATAPGAPQNLALQLTGQGIYASWQPPLASSVDYYNLYRATGTSITSIAGLTPLKTRIKSAVTYDTNPSPTQGAYVVTAVDAAGNESAISNSAYLNASLLPVRNLTVQQLGNDLPVLSWTAPNGTIAGYLVYVGPDANRTLLTPSRITALTFTDTGYTAGERRYTVATVDANGVELPRSLVLPSVTTQIASGLPIKRGVMNKVQVQVTNTSAASLAGVRVVMRLPVNQQATLFKDHRSEVFTLGANQTVLMPVIVGGYAGMPTSATAQIGVEIVANEGELVKIARAQAVDVTDGALVVGMATDAFTRGATGRLKLTIENTSDVDVELLTAVNNGAGESTELRFKLLDNDGNVLAAQPYKQIFGANVVTLTNGLTVARIPAGANYVSDTFDVNVPSSSPNSIRVRLEVDQLRYHSGQDDEVTIAGRGSERTVSLLDTAYYGEVVDVSPISSFGDRDVVISGRAIDRAGHSPLPNSRLKLVLNQQGFERIFSVLTDGAGAFSYTFKPTLTDAGLYKVSAVHPDVTDRPDQKAFTINRVTVGPTPYKLDVPKNYPFSIPFTARAGPGTAATNLRLTLDAASQPTGQLPAGVTTLLPPPVTLSERQTLNVPVLFTANNDAQPSGSLIFNVLSDEHAGSPIGQVKVDYTLTDAKPYLVSTPTFVETGLAQGGSQVESVSVKNSGLQDAVNLQFTLTKPDGTPAPSWAALASQADGTMAVGASRSIDLAFTPPSGTPEGVYEFRLKVQGENVPVQSLNVYVSLTQSGQGNLLFKAADLYTATVGRDGRLILGLANATVTVQNEEVATVTRSIVTDSIGEAYFQNLPAGRYAFKARAANHQEVGGRLLVKPGITANQPVFLDYNLITVEWSVREITIQDRYEITLNATFETDVPAAVVVLQPPSINLPKMNVGDVFFGELSLTNYGLVRADNVKQQLPQLDGLFRYEFLADVPNTLEAKQRVTLPYRVIALQSLEAAASGANASGGGCFNYSTVMKVSCSFQCANGTQSTCGSQASWFSVSNSSCPASGGGGSGGGSGGGWGGGGVGGFGGGGTSTPIRLKGKKCVYVPKGGMQCDR